MALVSIVPLHLNAKVKINRISFAGNKDVEDIKLKRQLKKTHEHPRFTLHRVLLGTLLSPKHWKELADSTKPVSWREVKAFFAEH